MIPDPVPPLGPVTPFRFTKGVVLHRIFDATFPANGFNPCQGQPSRFAPIYDQNSDCVPSLYAGESFDCTAFETVFHNISPAAKLKVVRLGAIRGRAYVKLRLKRPLRLAALFAPELKALRLRRSQLIDTSAKWYSKTAAWAAAIHNQYADLEGLVWTSRQCDPERAVLLFGDRVQPSDLEIVASQTDIAQSSVLLAALRRCGMRAAITIVS